MARYPWHMRAANEAPLGRAIIVGTLKLAWFAALVAGLVEGTVFDAYFWAWIAAWMVLDAFVWLRAGKMRWS